MIYGYNSSTETAKNCLKFIEMYRAKKDNNLFDDFYRAHLDVFDELIENWLEIDSKYYYIICEIKTDPGDDSFSPTYATILKQPYSKNEGVMFSSNLYDATKFEPSYPKLKDIFKEISSQYADREFKVISVSREVFGSNPRHLWSTKRIHGDYEETNTVFPESLF